MNAVYLIALVFTLGCMVLLDVRFRLFAARSFWRALAVVAIGVAAFLAWDLWAIDAGVFRSADRSMLIGVWLTPELPLEEIFFLTFLCYFTMIVYTGSVRILQLRGRRRAAESTTDQEARP